MFYDLTGETKNVNDKIDVKRDCEQQGASSAEFLCSLCVLRIDCRGRAARADNSTGGVGAEKLKYPSISMRSRSRQFWQRRCVCGLMA